MHYNYAGCLRPVHSLLGTHTETHHRCSVGLTREQGDMLLELPWLFQNIGPHTTRQQTGRCIRRKTGKKSQKSPAWKSLNSFAGMFCMVDQLNLPHMCASRAERYYRKRGAVALPRAGKLAGSSSSIIGTLGCRNVRSAGVRKSRYFCVAAVHLSVLDRHDFGCPTNEPLLKDAEESRHIFIYTS